MSMEGRAWRLPTEAGLANRFAQVVADRVDGVVMPIPGYRYENPLKRNIEKAVRACGGEYAVSSTGFVVTIRDFTFEIKIIIDGRV